MTDRRPLRPVPLAVVLGLSVVAALALWWAPPALIRWQDVALDVLVRLVPPPAPSGPPVVVVDIGETDDTGAPWTRAASARLAAAIAQAEPAAVGWDIVFAGDCDPAQPVTAALAAALSRAPTALGFLLSPTPPDVPAPPAVLAVADPAPAFWRSEGAEQPCPAFVAAARGLGALSLPGDASARVRLVPAAVLAAGAPRLSLPVETLRLALALPTPVIGGTPATLRLGDHRLRLDPGAMLRFRPSSAARRAARTLGAAQVLAGDGAARLVGAVVFVGSSLPSRGGLRPTAADPLYPSVQIAADLAEGMSGRAPALAPRLRRRGSRRRAFCWPGRPPRRWLRCCLRWPRWRAPRRWRWPGRWPAWACTPRPGGCTTRRLPALAVLAAATAGLLVQAAATARAERALRDRMGQLLPAPVVARLIADPRLLRLAGERREVTALFTDIEGFSALANRLPPEALIATLDRYFAAVSAIVLRHGGMIDKIVGDGVHALFNAPLDQPGHIDAALAAAAEIIAETEALRPELGLGRTRIGVETGPAILGDVGSGARIDYTAHGPAVNLAARLQEAGKTLGPAVIVGPAAAARASRPLRPLGQVEVRSFGLLALFTL
jgi:adenylate cyclase